MYKLLAAVISTCLILQVSAETTLGYLGPGATCATIAGPTPKKCAPGLNCCFAADDLSICYKGTCPKKFIPEGGLCDGIAGPIYGECWPGTTCCNLSPDNSVCRARCPK